MPKNKEKKLKAETADATLGRYDENVTMDAADVLAWRKRKKRLLWLKILIPLVIIASIVRFLVTDIDFIMNAYFRFCRSGMDAVAEYMLGEDAELTHISTTEGNRSYVQEHHFPSNAAKGINTFFKIMKVPYIDRQDGLVFFHVDGRTSEEEFNIYNRNYSDYFYCYTEEGQEVLSEYLEQDEAKIPFEIRPLKDEWYVVVKLYKIKSDDTEGNYESSKERE